MEDTRAGAGQGTVTGYDVSSVHYVLNTSDPQKVDAVTFSLDSEPPASSTIRVKLSDSLNTWYNCTFSGASVTCPTTAPQASVEQIEELVVVAAQ